MTLPTGTVTFLFTDIAGSTKLLRSLGDDYAGVLADHRDILRAAITKNNGHEVDTQGDSFFVAFPSASDAVSAAVETQRVLNGHEWPKSTAVRIRMGLHTGEPEVGPTGYVGMDVHRAARISEVGHGGQILLSATTEQLLRNDMPAGASMIYQGQHRLKDLSSPEHLFELRVHGLPSDFPPLRTLDIERTNLPTQTTSFVGREQELEEILGLILDPSCHLLTLVGPGGIGKTRLALQAAAQLSDEFSNGTYFIALEAIESAEFLITAVADALNYDIDKASFEGDVKEQLFGYLRGRSMLLLFDNFEHVMEGVFFLTELLEIAPEITLLVTSRERLNIKSEWTYDVYGMDHQKTETNDLSSAQALFWDRAKQADTGFELTEEQEPHAIRICWLVEGTPLAIEIAASWVRMFSCEQIAREIESGIEFLSSSMRDLPTRHRSMQAVFEYSWKLLSDDEKQILKRLAVFHGGFTISRAKSVAGASVATISNLVDKSHLRKGSEGRYEMHGLSRQYALSKLREVTEEERAALAAHAETYSNVLAQWELDLRSGKRSEALRDFNIEIGNVRAAWDWQVHENRVDLISNSMETLWLYYEIRNWFQEGYDKFALATTTLKSTNFLPYSEDLNRCLAKLLARQGWFAWRLGNYINARELVNQSLQIALETRIPSIQAFSSLVAGIVAYARGDLKEAKGLLGESLSQWREIEDRWGVATTLFYLGLVTHTRGEFGGTQQPYQYGLELFKDAGYQFGATFSHTSMGRVVQTLGDFMKAKNLCLESLTIRREMDDQWGMAACLDSLGVVECGLGELNDAREACLESLEIRKSLDDQRGIATSLNNLSHVAFLREEYDQAIRYCEEGLAIRRDLGNRGGIAASLSLLGKLTSTLDDNQGAKKYVLESLEIRKDLGDKAGMVASRNDLGSIALKIGQIDDACDRFRNAFKLATDIGAIPLSLEALAGLAECFLERGEMERAVELLSLVAHHDGSNQEIKTRAQELFQQVAGESQEASILEAWKRGSEVMIEEIEAEILGK